MGIVRLRSVLCCLFATTVLALQGCAVVTAPGFDFADPQLRSSVTLGQSVPADPNAPPQGVITPITPRLLQAQRSALPKDIPAEVQGLFGDPKPYTLGPGDIIIIRGYAPWDYYQEQHTHTFFIYEADPVTGMPMLLAGNSGRPRIIGWDTEMLRAPLRSIRYRIRPNVEWLYDELVLQEPAAEARWAPPLGVRFPG